MYGQSPYQDSGFQSVWLKHNLDFKGWDSQAHREFPRKFDSTNRGRDNLSRDIGRRTCILHTRSTRVTRIDVQHTNLPPSVPHVHACASCEHTWLQHPPTWYASPRAMFCTRPRVQPRPTPTSIPRHWLIEESDPIPWKVVSASRSGGGGTKTHGSILIRRQRGHPGVVLPLVISNSANHWEGMQLELSPIRNEPNWKWAMCTCTRIARVNVSAASCLRLGFSHRMRVA